MTNHDDEVELEFERAVEAAVEAEPPVPHEFGRGTLQPEKLRYERIGPLGRGGIGTVWQYRDRELVRDVAVKVLRQEYEISAFAIDQFVHEARLTGILQHPGIPPVYEVGRFDDGRVYLTMKLIRGQTLAARLRTNPCNNTSRAIYRQYLERICETVAFAHAQNIIHGDLKFNNVMIGLHGEVYVMDWGLAKSSSLANDSRHITLNKSMLTLDERDDVFRLSQMIFELITGQSITGPDSLKLLENNLESEHLRQILRAGLDPDRSKRPSSASELVRAFQDDTSQSDARLRELEREKIRIIERRRRLRLSLSLGTTIALLLFTFVSWRVWHYFDLVRNDHERRTAIIHALELTDIELRYGRVDRAAAELRRVDGLIAGYESWLPGSISQRQSELRMLERLAAVQVLDNLVTNKIEQSPRRSLEPLSIDREGPILYEAAFREFGINIQSEKAIQSILDTPIRAALVRALDAWALSERRSEIRERLVKLAELADDESFELARYLRNSFTSNDPAAIEHIADSLVERATPETIVALSRVFRSRGKLERADQYLTAARNRSPRDYWLNLEWGVVRALHEPDRPEQWRPGIEAAFALSNGNADTFTYLGIAQARANRAKDAEESFRRALSISPQLPGGSIRLAYTLAAQRKHHEALATIDEAIASEPTNPLGPFNRGVILHLLREDSEKIIAAYRLAVSLDNNFPDAWNNLGNALTDARKFDEADHAFGKALDSMPGYARAQFNRGVLNDLRQRIDSAVDCYRKTIEIDEAYTEAYYNLAHDLAYFKGQFAEAKTQLTKGLAFVPDNEPSRGKWSRLADSCQNWQRQEQRLTALNNSNENPSSAGEAIDLAVMAAWPHRSEFRKAVQYFIFAFEKEPKLAENLTQGYRYFAAGCAARIPEREARDRAREWLNHDLNIRIEQIKSGNAAIVADSKAKLRFWLNDPNFANIRDKAKLDSLELVERETLNAFWKRIRDAAE